MRTTRSLAAAGLALLLAGVALAQPKPQEAILGKWESNEKKGDADIKTALEFLRDGRTTMSLQITKGGKEVTKHSEEGTYKWLDDETIEVTVNKEAEKVKVKVTDKELTITPKKGEALKFARVGK
jgi:hypothetical protein